MRTLFLIRLAVDFGTAGLLLVALAYGWFDNATHEIIGTGIFLLLIGHNLFNRWWWAGIARGRRDARSVITKAMNLSLLASMLTLLVTSVIISQTVFSFLPITSTFGARRIHALASYCAMLIVAIHLGWHWSMIMGVAATRLGLARKNRLRTAALRLVAATIAAHGVHSWLEVDISAKLLMEMKLFPWDFATSTAAFFVHHVAIVGLCAVPAHIASVATQTWRGRGKRPRAGTDDVRSSPKA